MRITVLRVEEGVPGRFQLPIPWWEAHSFVALPSFRCGIFTIKRSSSVASLKDY